MKKLNLYSCIIHYSSWRFLNVYGKTPVKLIFSSSRAKSYFNFSINVTDFCWKTKWTTFVCFFVLFFCFCFFLSFLMFYVLVIYSSSLQISAMSISGSQSPTYDFSTLHVNCFFWTNPPIGSLLDDIYFSHTVIWGAEACV